MYKPGDRVLLVGEVSDVMAHHNGVTGVTVRFGEGVERRVVVPDDAICLANVDRTVIYPPWDDADFPLTPQEAWYIMKGYAVKPAKKLSIDDVMKMPGGMEMHSGYICLKQ